VAGRARPDGEHESARELLQQGGGGEFPCDVEVELGEALDWADVQDAQDAQRDLFEFIEVWYNRHRRHSTLGHRSPVAYEEMLVRLDAA